MIIKSKAERQAYHKQLEHRILKFHHRFLETLLNDYQETIAEVCGKGEEIRNAQRRSRTKKMAQKIARLEEEKARANDWALACEDLLLKVDYMNPDAVLFMEEDA